MKKQIAAAIIMLLLSLLILGSYTMIENKRKTQEGYLIARDATIYNSSLIKF